MENLSRRTLIVILSSVLMLSIGLGVGLGVGLSGRNDNEPIISTEYRSFAYRGEVVRSDFRAGISSRDADIIQIIFYANGMTTINYRMWIINPGVHGPSNPIWSSDVRTRTTHIENLTLFS